MFFASSLEGGLRRVIEFITSLNPSSRREK
jgi:hypothetical protein